MKPRITTVWNDRICEAIGSGIVFAPATSTFHEILLSFCYQTLGHEWYQEQLDKPETERHPYSKAMSEYVNWTARNAPPGHRSGQHVGSIPTGIVMALLNLAYDLYCVAHTSEVPDDLLGRLRNVEHFQGARYELYVAAAFARSDFLVRFVPPTQQGKTHDLEAHCPKSGETLAVECKCRRRPGAWGTGHLDEDVENIRVGVEALVNKAVRQKPASMPFCVFIDANFPQPKNSRLEETGMWTDLFRRARRRGELSPSNRSPYNLCVVTNHVYHMEASSRAGSLLQSAWVVEVPLYADRACRIPALHERVIRGLTTEVPER